MQGAQLQALTRAGSDEPAGLSRDSWSEAGEGCKSLGQTSVGRLAWEETGEQYLCLLASKEASRARRPWGGSVGH